MVVKRRKTCFNDPNKTFTRARNFNESSFTTLKKNKRKTIDRQTDTQEQKRQIKRQKIQKERKKKRKKERKKEKKKVFIKFF